MSDYLVYKFAAPSLKGLLETGLRNKGLPLGLLTAGIGSAALLGSSKPIVGSDGGIDGKEAVKPGKPEGFRKTVRGTEGKVLIPKHQKPKVEIGPKSVPNVDNKGNNVAPKVPIGPTTNGPLADKPSTAPTGKDPNFRKDGTSPTGKTPEVMHSPASRFTKTRKDGTSVPKTTEATVPNATVPRRTPVSSGSPELLPPETVMSLPPEALMSLPPEVVTSLPSSSDSVTAPMAIPSVAAAVRNAASSPTRASVDRVPRIPGFDQRGTEARRAFLHSLRSYQSDPDKYQPLTMDEWAKQDPSRSRWAADALLRRYQRSPEYLAYRNANGV